MNTNDINTAWLKSNTIKNTTFLKKAQNIEEKYSNRFNQLMRQERPDSHVTNETLDNTNLFPMYRTQSFIKGDHSNIRYGMQPPPVLDDDPSIIRYGMQPPPVPHDDPSIIRYGIEPPTVLYEDPLTTIYGAKPPPDDKPNSHHLYNIEVLPDNPVFHRSKPELVQNSDKNLEYDTTQFMKIFTNLFALFSSAAGNLTGQIRR
jgi:hypothetical protein